MEEDAGKAKNDTELEMSLRTHASDAPRSVGYGSRRRRVGLVGVHSIVVKSGIPSFILFFYIDSTFHCCIDRISGVLSFLCNKHVQHGATQ